MCSPPHSPWFNHPNSVRWRIQAVKFIILQFSPWSIFLLGPNILLSTLFSKTLSLCSLPKVRDQVSHPYSTTSKITVLYILIFRFFDMRREENRFELNNSKHSPTLIYSWFHRECHSDLLVSSQVFECCHIFKRFISYPYILVLSWVRMTRHDHIFIDQYPY
jgi:hypothetical protein